MNVLLSIRRQTSAKKTQIQLTNPSPPPPASPPHRPQTRHMRQAFTPVFRCHGRLFAAHVMRTLHGDFYQLSKLTVEAPIESRLGLRRRLHQ